MDIFIRAFRLVIDEEDRQQLRKIAKVPPQCMAPSTITFDLAHWHGCEIGEWFGERLGVGNCQEVDLSKEDLQAFVDEHPRDIEEQVFDQARAIINDKQTDDCDLRYCHWA